MEPGTAKRHQQHEEGVKRKLRLLCISSIIVEDQHRIDVEFLDDIVSGEPHTAAPGELTE